MNITVKTALTLSALILTPALAQDSMTMSHTGKFHALGAPTTGTVSVVEKNGQLTVTFKNLKTEVGPDLQVWLSAAAPQKGAKDADIAKAKYVKVGELKKFNGNFTFTAPSGTKLSDFKSVVIWCDQVKTAFGAADLM